MSGRANTEKEKQYIGLLAAHYVRIKSFIFSMLPNESDADDVMQETSITLWEKFDAFEQGTDFVAWAVTIAKYKVLEFRRKNQSNPLMLDTRVLELLEKENQSFYDQTEEKTQALNQCVQKLSGKDRNFLKLKYSHGFTLSKLSQRFGFSVTSAYRNDARIHGLLLYCIRRLLRLGSTS